MRHHQLRAWRARYRSPRRRAGVAPMLGRWRSPECQTAAVWRVTPMPGRNVMLESTSGTSAFERRAWFRSHVGGLAWPRSRLCRKCLTSSQKMSRMDTGGAFLLNVPPLGAARLLCRAARALGIEAASAGWRGSNGQVARQGGFYAGQVC